jgi:fatty acyl-CoA reductase
VIYLFQSCDLVSHYTIKHTWSFSFVWRQLTSSVVGRSENKFPNTDVKATSKNEDRIPIFNYVSSTPNPITWGEFMKLTEVGLNYPPSKCIWYYCFSLNKHRLIHNIYVAFLHLLPAIFMDTGSMIIGKQPM